MADLSPAEPFLHVRGTRRLIERTEEHWRGSQLTELDAAFAARRATALAERDRRWAHAAVGARWLAYERRRLRAALGIGPASTFQSRSSRKTIADRLERWRLFDDHGLKASALRHHVDQPLATVILVAGVDCAVPGNVDRTWIRALLDSGVDVIQIVRAQRWADGVMSRRAAGKNVRHVLHRLGFGIGRTPEGIEIEGLAALVRVIRRAARGGPLGRRPIMLVGVGGGARLAILAGAILDGFDLVAVDVKELPDLGGLGGPVDERLHGSATLAPPGGLRQLVRGRLLTDASPTDVTGLLAGQDLSGVAPSLLDEPWLSDESRRLGRDLAHRLRSELRVVRDHRAADLGEPVPVDQRECVTGRRRAHIGRMVSGPRKPTRNSRRRGVKSRLLKITDAFVAHEIEIDLGDLTVWGQLLRPRTGQDAGPALICQHGLDGQPSDVTGLSASPDTAYHGFGARLAEQGYTVFAPYLTVPAPQSELLAASVEAALSVGAMRTHAELRKLRASVDFLSALPGVDAGRIGYYGLSYGGYTAIWLGALEPRLAAIVISGHFNDWSTKLTDDRDDASFLRHPDEDFTTWRALESTTHAELIGAMWPRPVLIEWAEGDTTTNPAWHESAWAEVLRWSSAWGAVDRVQRAPFNGVHEIGGGESFDFLDRWLRSERSTRRDYVYRLLERGRDLDGISDHGQATLPYATRTADLDSPVLDSFWVGTDQDLVTGVALRLSRIGDPGTIVVEMGSAEGAADIARWQRLATDVHPVWDLWYEFGGEPIRLEPGTRYHLSIRCTQRPGPGDGVVVYGPRRLGGDDRPGSGRAAIRILGGPPDPHEEATHEFGRRLLDRPQFPRLDVDLAAPGTAREVEIDSAWQIDVGGDPSPIIETARSVLADGLRDLFGLELGETRDSPCIRLIVEPGGRGAAQQRVGWFEVRATRNAITLTARRPRDLIRAAVRLLDQVRERGRPAVALGTVRGEPLFAPRITTPALPGGVRYSETSNELTHTEALLRRMGTDGFDAVWVWVNLEEIAHGSAIFPELDEPQAPLRLRRLQEMTERAQRAGMDVYVYLAVGYDHPVPEAFYRRNPELRGHGFFGHPMCTSDPRVRAYHAEIVTALAHRAPGIRGVIVNFDIEGYYYCGNDDTFRRRCPRCRKRSQVELANEALTNLVSSVRAEDQDKDVILWSYGDSHDWVERLLPLLPAGVALQVDMSKGLPLERDGIRHVVGDYNLTLIGPPAHFDRLRAAARSAGLRFSIKTEHAVSQEAIFVPYIPAIDRWSDRAAAIRAIDAEGLFANWDHYGYTESEPARVLTEACDASLPDMQDLLDRIARRSFGAAAAPAVRAAWAAFSDGIVAFPYSDAVARSPGPLQKGPSHPLWLDPSIPASGSWRAWQNDLAWTEPWVPWIVARDLRVVRDAFKCGVGHLAVGLELIDANHRPALEAEWRIARTIEASLTTVLHLLEWIPVRDAFAASGHIRERRRLARRLRSIARAEHDNAASILPILEVDSRLGFASDGGGVIRGGLFTPALVRWKLGQLDDLLLRELPASLRDQRVGLSMG
jgi:dienelactone hydrolase